MRKLVGILNAIRAAARAFHEQRWELEAKRFLETASFEDCLVELSEANNYPAGRR